MYGFVIFSDTLNSKQCNRELRSEGYVVQNYMNDKFINDKLFVENDEYIIILDGVVTNTKSLKEKYHEPSWERVVKLMYARNGSQFFSEFRGEFAGALYDKKLQQWIIFSDHLSTKNLYYALIDGNFICAESLDFIYTLLKKNNICYHFDANNAMLLLTYGAMIEDKTLASEVLKLKQGFYLKFTNKTSISIERFYKLSNKSNLNLTEEECVNNIDNLFKNAVRENFEKDNEYGYKHFVALSAGLDCRMTSFVAHELGYEKQLNYTFSQTSYYDQIVPQKMTEFLNHEWIFKALDNGMWLYDIEEATRLSGGQCTYYTIAHTNSLFKYLNFKELGLVHTGQIGDVTISIGSKNVEPFSFGDGAYSPQYIKKVNFVPTETFENKELGMYNYRYLGATNYGIQNYYPYTETLSPFMNLDFLEFALSIPNKLRYNHVLYKKWIIERHPDAAKFVWEKIGCKITDPVLNIGHRMIPIKKIPHKILNQFRLKDLDSKRYMNPLGYYLANNEELKRYLWKYFDYADEIEDEGLRTSLLRIKETGSAIEQNQALSLLAAIKLYFS